MAMVDNTVTATTANKVNRSFALVCGNTAAMASAADAPQMATDPPDKIPSSRLRPSLRAHHTPITMVSTRADRTIRPTSTPSRPTCSIVMRAPKRATPMRNTVRAQKSTPSLACGFP